MKSTQERRRLWYHQKLEFGIPKQEAEQFLTRQSEHENRLKESKNVF